MSLTYTVIVAVLYRQSLQGTTESIATFSAIARATLPLSLQRHDSYDAI
ncbi:hypothetical protein [Nostoc sp.]